MSEYLSVTQVASILKRPYGQVRGLLIEKGLLVYGDNHRALGVPASELKQLAGGGVFPDSVPREDLLPLREIAKHLPFMAGTIKTITQLKKMITFGRWYRKNKNHCDRYRLVDFLQPLNWSTKYEAKFVELAKLLNSKGQSDKLVVQIRKLALSVVEVEREKRLGAKRALMYPDDAGRWIVDRYDKVIQRVNSAPWNKVRGILPKGWTPDV